MVAKDGSIFLFSRFTAGQLEICLRIHPCQHSYLSHRSYQPFQARIQARRAVAVLPGGFVNQTTSSNSYPSSSTPREELLKRSSQLHFSRFCQPPRHPDQSLHMPMPLHHLKRRPCLGTAYEYPAASLANTPEGILGQAGSFWLEQEHGLALESVPPAFEGTPTCMSGTGLLARVWEENPMNNTNGLLSDLKGSRHASSVDNLLRVCLTIGCSMHRTLSSFPL